MKALRKAAANSAAQPIARPIAPGNGNLHGISTSLDIRHYELPSRFADRYRPVRVHPRERGLAAFALDEYGLRFFSIMATGASVPNEAIWSLVHRPAECPAVQLAAGRRENALGYVVCELPHASTDPATYPVARRLTYRAKVTIAALRSLVSDLADQPAGSTADVLRFIEHRIDKLKT
jgi:hypothetical protein